MPFTFSIRGALTRSWKIFVSQPWFFIFITLVFAVLEFSGDMDGKYGVITGVLTAIASLMWMYAALSIAITVIDEKAPAPTFKTMGNHFPSIGQLLKLIGVSIVAAIPIIVITIVCGIIAYADILGSSYFTGTLAIPTTSIIAIAVSILLIFFFAIRLSFAQLVFIDRQTSIWQSVKTSWYMTRGRQFWTVLLTILLIIAMFIIGSALFYVGLLIAYPLSILLMVQLYRALMDATPNAVISEKE
jgi:uncharacterized membrane protein